MIGTHNGRARVWLARGADRQCVVSALIDRTDIDVRVGDMSLSGGGDAVVLGVDESVCGVNPVLADSILNLCGIDTVVSIVDEPVCGDSSVVTAGELGVCGCGCLHIHIRLPVYLQNLKLDQNSSIHNINTRGQHNIHTTRVQHEFAKHSLRYTLPRTINNTPNIILNKIYTHSLHGFATYIKNFSFKLII